MGGNKGAKVDVPNSNTTKIWAFEWYVVESGPKNGQKKKNSSLRRKPE